MNDTFLIISIVLFWISVGLTFTLIFAVIGFGVWEWWRNRKLFFPDYELTDWDDPE